MGVAPPGCGRRAHFASKPPERKAWTVSDAAEKSFKLPAPFARSLSFWNAGRPLSSGLLVPGIPNLPATGSEDQHAFELFQHTEVRFSGHLCLSSRFGNEAHHLVSPQQTA
jgi:hypothetical protein